MAAGLVSSPPFRLAQALASLTEPDGRGCAVDGLKELWSYRKPLGAEERELLDTLAARYKGRDWRDVLPVGGSGNVETVVGGTEGIDPLRHLPLRPDLQRRRPAQRLPRAEARRRSRSSCRARPRRRSTCGWWSTRRPTRSC